MRLRALVIGALVVVGPLLAACEPAPTSISAAFTPNAIDVGRNAEVRGTISPATTGTTVVLERQAGSEWRSYGSTKTTSGGAVYFHLTKPGVGTYGFRVRSGATSSPTFYLKVHDRVRFTQRPGPWGYEYTTAPQTLGSTTYPYTVSTTQCAGISYASLWAQPASEFRVMETYIGMAMSSPTGAQRRFEIYTDGKLVGSGTANIGSNHRTRVDLVGVDVVEVRFWSTPMGCTTPQSKGTFVLGDPYLYR